MKQIYFLIIVLFLFSTAYAQDDNLPVELTSFNAELVNNSIVLNWRTAIEENNEGFEVQKSVDGNRWETLGFVQGNGTANEVTNYTFTDNKVLTQNIYYRLNQIDFDNVNTYSDIITVYFNTVIEEKKVFPNPAHSVINVSGNTDGFFEIYNSQGQIMLRSNSNMIDISYFSSGLYFIKEIKLSGEKTQGISFIKH